MSVFRNRQLDLSHRIRSLSFGAAYPGQKNPLDGTLKALPAEQSMGQHEYFIKLVPTTYKKARGRSLKTNQVCTPGLYLCLPAWAECFLGRPCCIAGCLHSNHVLASLRVRRCERVNVLHMAQFLCHSTRSLSFSGRATPTRTGSCFRGSLCFTSSLHSVWSTRTSAARFHISSCNFLPSLGVCGHSLVWWTRVSFTGHVCCARRGAWGSTFKKIISQARQHPRTDANG